MALPKLQTVISRETFHQTATVIFFHGEHGTAEGMKAILKHILQKEFNFRHIRVIYPQAPCIPYKMNEGKPSRVWFNRSSYSPTSSENRTSIDHTCSLVRQLVNEQKSRGVGLNRVVLGGFGMGGILAMHVAFRFLPQVAGVFGLSSLLGPQSLVFTKIKQERQKERNKVYPPLWLWHGSNDDMAKFKWAVRSAEFLMDLNLDVDFKVQYGQEHEIVITELVYLQNWICEMLPEVQ